MKLAHKISGAFLLGAALMGGAVFTSTQGINQTTASLENLSLVDQVSLSAYEDMYAEGLQTGQALRNVLINPNDDKAKKNLEVANTKFDQKIKQAMDVTMDSDAIEALTQLKANWDTDRANKERAMSMIANGDTAGAREFIMKTETPSWRVVRAALIKEIGIKRDMTSKEVASTISAAKKAAFNSLVISAIGFALSLLLMVFGLVQMSSRLKLVDHVMSEIGDRGNLTVDIPTNGSDEVNALLVRFDAIRSRLSAIVAGVNGGADTLTNGKDLSVDEAKRLGLQLRSLIAMFRHQ